MTMALNSWYRNPLERITPWICTWQTAHSSSPGQKSSQVSHHNIPYCEFIVNTTKKKQAQYEVPIYAKANWTSLKEMAVNLSSTIVESKDTTATEELWNIFKTTLQNAVKEHIPHKTTRAKISQPWATAEIRKLIHNRNWVYKRMKKTGSEKLKAEAKNLRRIIQRQLRHSYWRYINNIFTEENASSQTMKNKRLWSYIKHQRSSNAGVAPLKKDGRLTSDPKEQAEVLNLQFQSVFGNGKRYTEEEFMQKTGMHDCDFPTMEDIEISERGVTTLLQNLNPHKACGSDGIWPHVLKELAREIAPALTALFKSSLSSGSVPADWRDAHITPIYKKGEQYNPANYRPVSLTSVVCKLLEHIIVSAVMRHSEENSILTDNQHGFRRGRSCETQLLELVEELTTNLESSKQTDILITDFSKASDKMNHSLLLHKLQRYGIHDTTNTCIANFLNNRRQAVVVSSASSHFVNVMSGVLQGSVLGPCLFLTYISDMPEKLLALVQLFAENMAVYKTISKGHDQAQLQEDLQWLTDWEESWDMEFHPAKCQTLLITRSRKPLQPSYILHGHTLENVSSANSYILHGHTLENVSSAKYLGVTINNTVSWDDHISNTCSKANRALVFLRRNLKISASNIKKKAYKVFVRPLLEYAASVWDPYSQKNIAKIEAVQRRVVRFVLSRFRNTSSVNNMLEALGWPTLEQRCQTCGLSMLYKIQSGLAHCPTLKAKLVPLPSR